MKIITSASLIVREGQTAIKTLTVTGAGSVAWTITGGADAADLTLVEATGVLTFNVAPDMDAPADADANNRYHVDVTATRSDGVASKSFTIDVVRENYRFPRGANRKHAMRRR